jgi:hypothetical protein
VRRFTDGHAIRDATGFKCYGAGVATIDLLISNSSATLFQIEIVAGLPVELSHQTHHFTERTANQDVVGHCEEAFFGVLHENKQLVSPAKAVRPLIRGRRFFVLLSNQNRRCAAS